MKGIQIQVLYSSFVPGRCEYIFVNIFSFKFVQRLSISPLRKRNHKFIACVPFGPLVQTEQGAHLVLYMYNFS